MADEKKMRLFIHEPAGEPQGYIGDWGKYAEREKLRTSIADFVDATIENALEDGDNLKVEIQIFGRMMTDSEVEALPEL